MNYNYKDNEKQVYEMMDEYFTELANVVKKHFNVNDNQLHTVTKMFCYAWEQGDITVMMIVKKYGLNINHLISAIGSYSEMEKVYLDSIEEAKQQHTADCCEG